MKGGLGGLMRQAQRMQEEYQRAKETLTDLEVTGESGGGMVKVLMNGRHEVSSVKLDATLALDDRELVEDLVTAAINDAVRQIDSLIKERFEGMAGDLGLPPGFNLPF